MAVGYGVVGGAVVGEVLLGEVVTGYVVLGDVVVTGGWVVMAVIEGGDGDSVNSDFGETGAALVGAGGAGSSRDDSTGGVTLRTLSVGLSPVPPSRTANPAATSNTRAAAPAALRSAAERRNHRRRGLGATSGAAGEGSTLGGTTASAGPWSSRS